MTDILERMPASIYDYFFLISRGYTSSQAISIISSKYRLKKEDKILLKRCIHSRELNKIVQLKIVDAATASRSRLCIDGFNQLLTLAAGLSGKPVYRCTDGIIRDNELGGIELTGKLGEIGSLLAHHLSQISPRETIIVLDYQKPRSKNIAHTLKQVLNSHGLARVIIKVAKKADSELKYLSPKCVIAS